MSSNLLTVPNSSLSKLQRAKKLALQRIAADPAQSRLAGKKGGILSFAKLVPPAKLFASAERSTVGGAKRSRPLAGTEEPTSHSSDSDRSAADEADDSEQSTGETGAPRAPRRAYSTAMKHFALSVYRSAACLKPDSLDGGYSARLAALRLIRRHDWDPQTTTGHMITRFLYWQMRDHKPRGRPVCTSFETAVRNEMMVKLVDGSTVSAAYSMAMVQEVARSVQRWPIYQENPSVKRLKFSSRWFLGWNLRQGIL
jgi:hypothetical protein